MHDKLAEILDEDVVGEITQLGDVVYDVGFGRVCLDTLHPAPLEEMERRLQRAFSDRVEVTDRVRADDEGAMVRGLWEARIPDDEAGGQYLLQVSTADVLAFYERRFAAAAGVPADLMSTVAVGLSKVFADGREQPLRRLSGYDDLMETYLEQLDGVLRDTAAGRDAGIDERLEQLIDPVRRCWVMVPWPLREAITPTWHPAGERVASHDNSTRRTTLLAVDAATGKPITHNIHQHTSLETYSETLDWMLEVRAALAETYPEPAHLSGMFRARSVEQVKAHYPRFRGTVIPPEDVPEEGEKEGQQ